MYPRMERSNPPVTLDAIRNFEQSRNLTLSAEYVDFLLATNGGSPASTAFPIRGLGPSGIGIIQSFSGIGVLHPTEELSYSFDLYAGAIPKDVLLIAGNGGGDYICLDYRTGSTRVAFWDKGHFWGTGEWRESDLYHVANSFGEFLESLRPSPH